jgi:hypothetical protein
VSHLRIFGSKAFAHIPKEDRRKLDAKAVKCIFIGYCTEYKAYKMFDPNNHKVFASRDVLFHENADEVRKTYDYDVWNLPKENEENDNEKEEEVQGEAPSIVDSTSSQSMPRRGEGTPQRSEELRRKTRQSKTPVRYRDYALITQAMNVVEPLNYEQAKDHKEWMDAMKEEHDSIIKNETRELTELSENKTPIGSKWLFKYKFNVDGSIDKYKARLVSKGYSQKEGIDYEDTFAPVAKMNTIRLMIALATKNNWQWHQLDVKSTFLNGELKEEVYLVQPEGFVKKGKEHLVCKLKKDLYGLKQGPRSWYEKIDTFFFQQGFIKSKSDPNLYIKKDRNGQIALISLYVDDLIITGSATGMIEEIKIKLSQQFEMKDLGHLHYCLGLEVWRENGKTLITQSKYTKEVLRRFNMNTCKPISTPLEQNVKLSNNDDSKEVDGTLY